jgi:hypothetical protein
MIRSNLPNHRASAFIFGMVRLGGRERANLRKTVSVARLNISCGRETVGAQIQIAESCHWVPGLNPFPFNRLLENPFARLPRQAADKTITQGINHLDHQPDPPHNHPAAPI